MKKCVLFAFLLVTQILTAQKRYDVVIDEIMADPSPQVGLPPSEWVELKNISSTAINLQGWRICDLNGESGSFPSYLLQPGSFVIIAGSSAATALSTFGAVISVTSFPSIDNNGETIFIKAADGRVIHGIKFNAGWYHNDLKKEGGWSLEMIDTHRPCIAENNWKASTDKSGGTPGNRNSVDGTINDTEAPKLVNAFTSDSVTIHLVFGEPLDSSTATILSNYQVDEGVSLKQVEIMPPLFNEARLTTNTILSQQHIYTVQVAGVRDCVGNILTSERIRTGMSSDAFKDDIVINEILFNPRTNGYDYVELYNKSDKIIDAAALSICNRKADGSLNSITSLATAPRYILPQTYLVVTEDAPSLALNYLVKDENAVLAVPSLPSFPDDEGEVIIINQHGDILDEVVYSEKWHFKLIENAEGVSLEKIDMNTGSQDAANWHSAASTAGYGTPGYKNSQFRRAETTAGLITISSDIFSPDNDGFEDYLVIHYKLEQPGYVGNITIFDATGRPVRNLVRNQLLGMSGSWNWDGLDEKGLKLRIGTYIILAELFNLEGRKQRFRHAVVLARRLGQ